MGESKQRRLRVDFDRRLKLEFHGSKVTSGAALLADWELGDAVELTGMAGDVLGDSRTGKNGRQGSTISESEAEQYIKEGNCAIKYTRLSWRKFRTHEVWLQLHALAYNLRNFMRTLALPKEPFRKILCLIDDLRRRSALALAG